MSNSNKPDEHNVRKSLKILEDYWIQHPYLRLGQIIVNAFSRTESYKRNPEPDLDDLFYVSDELLLAVISHAIDLKNESKSSSTTEG
jgi:hypothetical protein